MENKRSHNSILTKINKWEELMDQYIEEDNKEEADRCQKRIDELYMALW